MTARGGPVVLFDTGGGHFVDGTHTVFLPAPPKYVAVPAATWDRVVAALGRVAASYEGVGSLAHPEWLADVRTALAALEGGE